MDWFGGQEHGVLWHPPMQHEQLPVHHENIAKIRSRKLSNSYRTSAKIVQIIDAKNKETKRMVY